MWTYIYVREREKYNVHGNVFFALESMQIIMTMYEGSTHL